MRRFFEGKEVCRSVSSQCGIIYFITTLEAHPANVKATLHGYALSFELKTHFPSSSRKFIPGYDMFSVTLPRKTETTCADTLAAF